MSYEQLREQCAVACYEAIKGEMGESWFAKQIADVIRALPLPDQKPIEPIGFVYLWGIGKMRADNKIYASFKECNDQAKLVKSCTEVHQVYTAPPYTEALHKENTELRKLSDDLLSTLSKRCYVMSESNLPGYRLLIGFEGLEDVQAAHSAIVNIKKGGAA
ncbi:hypothetical protein [Undibacterium crateris]|uniref:hypothetical protein n=1 Tax=Undibacterium crateris TaxID=2528175 RepID=UPI00138A0260|nr:hypothetical protein [Undibacterium crateris]NDI85042.1 hypothetical protein [Undibacterium crateris]